MGLGRGGGGTSKTYMRTFVLVFNVILGSGHVYTCVHMVCNSKAAGRRAGTQEQKEHVYMGYR